MNREDVAMDVTVQNVEILRGRLERVELALAGMLFAFDDGVGQTWSADVLDFARKLVKANEFDASQQGEPCISDTGSCGVGGYCAECPSKHPEQAEGAQGDADDLASPMRERLLSMGVDEETAESIAAELAICLIPKLMQREAALAQPSPAPELERPEVVGNLYLGGWADQDELEDNDIELDMTVVERLQAELASKGDGVHMPLMTVSQHDRIVGALRVDWNEVRQGLIAQRDAAQARVAELEKQEPVAWVDAEWIAQVSDPRGAGCTVRRAYGSAGAELSPLYAAPVAQAGQAKKWTYASEQETNCAGCGVRKHTPLRVDWMGGYVCLTCIDEKLEELYEALPDDQAGQVPDALRSAFMTSLSGNGRYEINLKFDQLADAQATHDYLLKLIAAAPAQGD